MFGYVRPFKSELLVREYGQYKAAYCQLCRALKDHYGRAASFTLSYDCTFYALLALSTQEAKLSLHHGRCVVNPLKKCDFLRSDGEAYHKAAALSVLLTYHKLRDNVEDDSFAKSLGSRVLLRLLSRKARKAADEAMNQALNATAAQMLLAFQLVDLRNFGPILENVVEKGLPELQREILFLHIREKKKKRPEPEDLR